MDDNLMRDYHDRATRGLPLSEAERGALEDWYAAQDAAEASLLNRHSAPAPAPLQAQIDAGLAELTRTMQQIQALSAENDALRQEVAGLYRQLAQPKSAQGV